jgi:uncharacterized phage protein (TIGR01671 family)
MEGSQMTREIKFRAWSSDTKEMIPWEEAMFPEWLDYPDMVLMQFTGIKDKRGKEIYEGDLVKISGWGIPCVEVSWVGSGFCLVNRSCCEACAKGHGCICPLDEVETDRVEVLGNIYENSELLEAKP